MNLYLINWLFVIACIILRNTQSKLLENKSISKKYLTLLRSKATFEIYQYEEHPFKGLNFKQLKKKLGLLPESEPGPQAKRYSTNIDLPDYFNSKDKWPQCIHSIRDQQQCGSCWAFAITEVLSDRFCIASNGTINNILSPQDLVSCDGTDGGCGGGELVTSWKYMISKGSVKEECYPYTAGKGIAETCNLAYGKCPDFITDAEKFKAKNYYSFYTVEDIKNEIFLNGPVETGFDVYMDFFSYKGGVYKLTSDEFAGRHAVKIIGWGKEEKTGTNYWIVANSWGEQWGENGYFRIEINNCCNFEDQAIAGLPNIK